MIDWVEELLSMTATEHMDEDTDGESAILSLGGMAVNAVPPGRVHQDETMDSARQDQGPSLMGAVDDGLREENGSGESITTKPVVPTRDAAEDEAAGTEPMSRFLGAEEESAWGLSRLMRQIGMPDTFAMAVRAAGEPMGIDVDRDEGAGIEGKNWVRADGDNGLWALYREVAKETSPSGQAAAGQPSVGMAEPGALQQPDDRLTVDGMDQAVRRDSRRYDGGMTLF